MITYRHLETPQHPGKYPQTTPLYRILFRSVRKKLLAAQWFQVVYSKIFHEQVTPEDVI